MTSERTSLNLNRQWRWMSFLFLSLLPLFALFHLGMWFAFTRTLFRPETGDLKRMGYLVGLEDRKAKLVAQEPKSGYELLFLPKQFENRQVTTMLFGDSFAASLAEAYSLRTKQPVGLGFVNWEGGNGLSQIKTWVGNGWYRQHGVRTIIVERVEYAWLDTFADEGNPAYGISWETEQASFGAAPVYPKAVPWTFANNGNFKVLFCNLAYLVSPTAFKMTDACVVRLKQKFFDCSYGNELLFYRGELRGALTSKNQKVLEAALKNAQDVSDFCRQRGMTVRFVVPPVKSFLYYDWVDRPFYHDSKLLETLQTRATPMGYVDVKQRFHRELQTGYQDLYYADDAHWNFPAAEMAAEELTKAKVTP